MLISVYLTINFKDTKKYWYLILAVICSYISFLWKPTGIVSPFLVVAILVIFYNEIRSKTLFRIIAALGIAAFALGLFRLLTDYSGKLNELAKAVFDILFYPIVSLSHVFINYQLMFRLSDSFIKFYYPEISKDGNFQTVSHYVVSDYISIIISLIILFGIYLLYKNVSKFNKKVLIFGLVVFSIQFTPIALFYIDRGISYVGSRHVYPAVIGISIMFGVLFDLLIGNFKKTNVVKRYLYLTLFALIGVWFYKEMLVTRREVRAQAIDDIAIKKTWYAAKALKLPNSNKVVIFLTSDRSYYYPEWHLPFKEPAAYMLPLAFYGKPFIDRSSLGELNYNNTFIDKNNKQFGYFTDLDPLVSQIKKGKIDIKNVVGLHFIDKTLSFEITTDQTRKLIDDKLVSN